MEVHHENMDTPGTLTLTTDVVMNRAGVYDLVALKELILRDEELTHVDETCAQTLASLEILSLSHNRLASLEHFQYLVNLIELNVNFNQIERLDNLQIVDISPLRKLPELNTLSVYGNCITDLDSALHTCRSLPRHLLPEYEEVWQRQFRKLRFRTVHLSTNVYIDKNSDADYDTGTDPFASNLMPRGNVRLFRDDFLNNNPILLEYLSQDAGGVSASVENTSNSTLESDQVTDDNSLPTTSSFVDKMRSANPLPRSETGTTVADAVDSTNPGGLKKLSLSPSVSTSHLGVDPSDPNTTIRKLLKHIEVLMETLDKCKNHQLDAVSKSLLEENKQLQTENNNLPILQEEIRDLKKQLASAQGDPGEARMLETKRVKSLEQQNASLQRENARLREMLLRQTKETEKSLNDLKSPRTPSDGNETAAKHQSQRLAHSELLDESSLIDMELTELILHNEVSLELIRNGIKNTKKEWEEHFQQAKVEDTARVRPQTSMGFTSYSSRSREGLDSFLGVAQDAATRDRRLHTSAGFRNGPEAHLLRQMPVHPLTSIRETSSSDGSSTTNILTL
ncbi:hypothetical protein AM587_10009592 [Phytophthora nicotianae]|uniref:Uncharacterized protein n=1 Tax=Phytophthora nicotianae TaxID=4792 RepID=A0A0W8CRY6_PHYNI|nr:hypothetical protein AM587_10009592 [Phytophthora nicotianae]